MGWNCPSEEASAAPLPLDDVSLGIFLWVRRRRFPSVWILDAVGVAPLWRTLRRSTATSLRLLG